MKFAMFLKFFSQISLYKPLKINDITKYLKNFRNFFKKMLTKICRIKIQLYLCIVVQGKMFIKYLAMIGY